MFSTNVHREHLLNYFVIFYYIFFFDNFFGCALIILMQIPIRERNIVDRVHEMGKNDMKIKNKNNYDKI